MISNRELFLRNMGQTSVMPYMLEIVSASGIYLTDVSGKQYIDLISGVSVSNLGHNNSEIIEAITKQLHQHMHLMVYGEFIVNTQTLLAEKLCSLLPEDLNSVYYVNSGSEAIEAALKLAKRHTGRSGVISFRNAYHGSSAGALSICGNEDFKNSFRPLVPDIHIAAINTTGTLNYIDHNTACVVIEPVQAEAGVFEIEAQFMRKLREQCTRNQCLLIFDEIQTGFGRTGSLFAFEHYNIVPDVLCLAKAFGGGMPLGGIVANKTVMDCFMDNPPLGHITTFGGHPVSCAAALASLEILSTSKLYLSVYGKEQLFRKLLKHWLIKEIRGKGLLLAVDIGSGDRVNAFIRKALNNGIISDGFIFYDSAFRIAPPLNISPEEIEKACRLILLTLDEIA